jgi:hypothetical protein
MEFEGRSEYSERNDCVIRAFSVVSGKSYVEVHKEFSAAGRRSRCKTKSTTSASIAKEYGWKKVPCRMTVAKFLDNVKHAGSVVARVSGHMFAVVDGEITDIYPVRPKRIVTYYYTKEAV